MQLDAGILIAELPFDRHRVGVFPFEVCLHLARHPPCGRDPTVEATPCQQADLDLRHVQPAPVRGRVVELEPLAKPPRLLRRERLVERRRNVRVEIVHDHHDLLRGGEKPGQMLKAVGEINGSPPPRLRDEDIPFPEVWHGQHETRHAALPHIFRIMFREAARPGGQRGAAFGEELLGELVEADKRPLRVNRQLVNREHILHGRYEGRVLFRRHAPALFPPRLEFAFFKTRRTEVREMLPMISSSTSFPAMRPSVQRASPSGGSLQARRVM